MELSELQKRVDTWIREYGVRYFSELTNMAILTEEVGELARVMARKYGDQSFKAGETRVAASAWPNCGSANSDCQRERRRAGSAISAAAGSSGR